MIKYKKELDGFESFLKNYFSEQKFQYNKNRNGQNELYSAIKYSLFSGGKRFRPLLSLLTGQALGLSAYQVYPFAASVECIHTYSLIHDDLPCMDNDDFRRGQPTNHKVFGEDIALLAGDALISEAFVILSQHYQHQPYVALNLIQCLGHGIGPFGMVAGQALDLRSRQADEDLMKTIHSLKTGALIETSILGVAKIAKASEEQTHHLKKYGQYLGQAFQLADDIHDAASASQKDEASMLSVYNLETVKKMLKTVTEKAIDSLSVFSKNSAMGLVDIAQFNLNRKK